MLTMIIGGSGSGKSLFAEEYVIQVCKEIEKTTSSCQCVYIATMIPSGSETLKKIERHREQRQGKDFLVKEQYQDIFATLESRKDGEEKNEVEGTKSSVVLLECLSNLVANELYDQDRIEQWINEKKAQKRDLWAKYIVKKIVRDIQILEKQCDHLVVVTNDVFREGFGIWEGTKEYLWCLGAINQELVKDATSCYEVVAGIPICIKGEQQASWYGEKEVEESMAKRILVLGGAFQGKKEWIKQRLLEAEEKKTQWKLIEHLEDIIKEQVTTYCRECFDKNYEVEEKKIFTQIWKKLEKMCIKEKNYIFIVNEIGAGMVPMGKEERIYREMVGRITCEIAKQADEVYRIVAGCPMKVKK